MRLFSVDSPRSRAPRPQSTSPVKRKERIQDSMSPDPPKRMRKRDRELMLHSENMNAYSDEDDEPGSAAQDADIDDAFSRR